MKSRSAKLLFTAYAGTQQLLLLRRDKKFIVNRGGQSTTSMDGSEHCSLQSRGWCRKGFQRLNRFRLKFQRLRACSTTLSQWATARVGDHQL